MEAFFNEDWIMNGKSDLDIVKRFLNLQSSETIVATHTELSDAINTYQDRSEEEVRDFILRELGAY